MPLIGGKPHTQLLNLNVLDELRVDGVLVSTGAATLLVGQVPKSNGSGGLIYAGATVDVTTGEWTFDQSINVPTASIKFGQVITLSEGTNALLDRENVTGSNRAHLRTVFTSAGSTSPEYFKLSAQANFVVNADFSQTITTNPLLFQITSVGDVQVNVLHFKTGAAMANVRIRIKDNATGIVLRFLPDEASWNTGLNGFAFITGDNRIDLVSVATSTPGVINLGLSPFRFNNTQVLDIEVRATAVNLLGNVSSFPFLNVDQQPGVDTTIPEVATGFVGTTGSVLFIDSAGQIAENNTNFFWDNSNQRLIVPDLRSNASLAVTALAGGLDFTCSGDMEFVSSGGDIFFNNNDLYIDRVNNRVGVQISVPTATLHVVGTGKFTAALDMTSQFINNVLDPVSPQDAATRNYVDTHPSIVTKVGTPVDNQVAIWTGDGPIEGDPSIVFDGTTRALRIGVVPGTITNDSSLELVKNTLTGVSDVMQRWTWQPGTTLWGLRLDQEFNTGLGRIQYNFTMRNGVASDVDMLSFAGGNVGIGTKLPTSKAHIVGDIRVSGAFLDSSGDPGTNGQTLLSTVTGTNWSDEVGNVSTSDVLTNNVLIRGNGTTDLDACEGAGTGTVFVNDDANELLIRAGTSSAKLILQNSAGVDVVTIQQGLVFSLLKSTSPWTIDSDAGISLDASAGPIEMDVGVGQVFDVDNGGIIYRRATRQTSIGSNNTPLGDLTLFQRSAQTSVNKGLVLTGTGVTSPDTSTQGVALIGGQLSAGNNQLWIVNHADQFDAAKNSFRFITGSDCPLIVGVNNIGTLNRNLCFGLNVAGAGCGFGFPTTAAQADIEAKIHIQTGQATEIGLIVQGFTSQTANLFETRNSAGTVSSVITPSFDWGLGTPSPNTRLHVLDTLNDTIGIITTQNTGTNPGITAKHVGDRDPQGNVTAAGGAEYYRDSGATSGTYESREAGTGTNWLKRSVNSSSTIEILSTVEFDALASGGIVTISVNTTLHIKGSIVTANRIVVNTGITLHITATNFGSKNFVYTGTGTFITTAGGTVRILASVSIVSVSTGTFISFSGTGTLSTSNIAIVGWDNIGTFSDGLFIQSNVAYVNCDSGWTFTDASAIVIDIAAQSGTTMNDSFFTINTKNPASFYGLNNVSGSNLAASGAALFNLNGRISNTAAITITNSGVAAGKLFLTTSLTNSTINSVVDSSPAAGTITQLADDVTGVSTTVFSTTTYFEDEEVTITGTTSYNGTFQIFGVVAGVSYKIVRAFVADDATGSIASVRIAMTLAVGNQPVTGDQIKIIDTNFYNGFRIALNVATNVLTVNDDFRVTDTGSIKRGFSLDETDSRVKASNNFGFADSEKLAFGKVNNNTTVTAITDGAYLAIDCSSIDDKDVTQGFRLTNATNGVYEYIRNDPFNGSIEAILNFLKTGSTQNYRVAFSINGAVPVFATADFQPAEITTTIKAQTMLQIVNFVKGDTFQVMAAGDGTGDDCTFTDVTLLSEG